MRFSKDFYLQVQEKLVFYFRLMKPHFKIVFRQNGFFHYTPHSEKEQLVFQIQGNKIIKKRCRCTFLVRETVLQYAVRERPNILP